MKALTSFPRILLYRGFIDFRKRRRSLAALVESHLQEDPFSETLFLFVNRRRDCVRALYWDKTGFAMWEKELEKERFPMPRKSDRSGSVILDEKRVQWLLEGVDIWKLKPHAELSYSRVC
jgi:transposase